MISENYDSTEELEPMEYGDNEEPFTSDEISVVDADANENAEEDAAAADYFKLDYTLTKPEERVEFLNKLIKENEGSDKLKNAYLLKKMSDYIMDAVAKQEKKQADILTDNKMVTVNKRELSFEGLVAKIEERSKNGNAGGDSIYNHIANDKNIIFTPKISITDEDIAEVPGLRALREDIAKIEEKFKVARGRNKFLLKKQLIEMRKDQYVLKNNFRRPINCINVIKSFSKIDLSEEIGLDENNKIYSTGLINFFNPTHVSALLCNYSRLKEDSWDNFVSDTKWVMMDFDDLVDRTFKDKYPLYYKIIIYKIDGMKNTDIQIELQNEFGVTHSVEYISSLWRNKIPKMIAEQATNEWLEWHYTFEEKGNWKRCSRCGKIKLAHNNFFSKNSTSKDGFYSICKECRNQKKG